jgi:lysophospholipase L1-like esterase
MKYRRFLFQGDSITDGNRGRSDDPNHILGHSHAFSIGSRLMADFPCLNLEFFNRGVSGNSHVELEKRWQEDCLDLNPDVLTLLAGINGCRQACGIYADWEENHPDGPDPAQSAENFEAALRRMLTALRDRNPEVLLVICLPFFYGIPAYTREQNQAMAAVLRERREILLRLAGEYRAVTIDFKEALDAAIAINGSTSYWCWDGVHVTVAGYEILARKWLRTMKGHIDFLAGYHVAE